MQPVSSTNIHKAAFDSRKESVIGQTVPVTRGSRDAWLPDISPDGKWLTFGSSGKREDIFIVKSDGTGLRQLTDDADRDRAPVWSPDGTRIAFMSGRQTASGAFEIWLIRPDGSGLQQLTYTSAKVSSVPVWSPDGNRLAYPFQNYDGFIIEVNKPWQAQSPRRLPPMNEAHERYGLGRPTEKALPGNVEAMTETRSVSSFGRLTR